MEHDEHQLGYVYGKIFKQVQVRVQSNYTRWEFHYLAP